MSVYQYKLGQWIKLESLRVPDEQHESMDSWLKRSGFNPYDELEFGIAKEIIIYGNDDETAFIALVDLFCLFFKNIIYIDDLPSLFKFIREVAEPFDTNSIKYNLGHIKDGFEKLFKAQHGHSMDSVCDECKPE